MSLVRSIDHVGIAVPDLEAAIAFYRETLGLQVTHREVNEEQGVVEAMLRPVSETGVGWPGAPVRGAALQLLAPLNDESPIARHLAKRGPGLQQLAFRVEDLPGAITRMKELGIRVLYSEPRRGTADSLITFLHPGDTGGVLIELVQYR
jgi:methylmalonyl-CoA/ethylmalonyl-CoA epimerase